MNANELADWLEYKSALTEYSCVKEAAKQLRQQKAEIEALKKELHIAEEGYALLHKIHFKQGKK